MKLDPEGVAKAEAAMALANPYSETYAEDRVIAALTAYFDHLKEVGLMREAGGTTWNHGELWEAKENATFFVDGFPAFILRTDKE